MIDHGEKYVMLIACMIESRAVAAHMNSAQIFATLECAVSWEAGFWVERASSLNKKYQVSKSDENGEKNYFSRCVRACSYILQNSCTLM